ncbi:hypothetical protein ACFVFQ_07845 [Streptomyces sp. NPDC057743]|uniref:hypothetical protein n=1 Tax=Streptomyces sp. NPDC057743 TaxID=3346236 RepID=UPI0036CFC4DA
MSGFQAPSQDEFHQYAGLTSKQAGHLAEIQSYADHHCSKDDDLEGLLLPLRLLVPKSAQFFAGKLAQCHRGMGVIEDKTRRTSGDYAKADQQAMTDLHAVYPGAISHFPNIAGLPGASQVANFTDEPVSLKEPTNAEEATTKNIHHQLLLLGMKSELKTADKVFSFLTGQSLVELLLKPILGDYGRLLYLHDAYDNLGDAVYTVAGTLRKGSWALGSEWKGDTGTAFDSYLFQWTMGIGGIGDAAKLVAKAYKDCYDVVIVLLHQALREVDDLINEEIEEAVQKVADALNFPMPTVGSLINDVEQRGFSFEKSGGWSPAAGAVRIGMLPAA